MKTLFLILIFCPAFIIGQLSPEEEQEIISLKQIIKDATHDTIVINGWKAWDEIIWVSDAEQDFRLNRKIDSLSQLNLSKSKNQKNRHFFLESRAEALNIIGLYYRSQGEYKQQ